LKKDKLLLKINEFCNKTQSKACIGLSDKIGKIYTYYPEGFKVNIIVKGKIPKGYTLLVSKYGCKVLKGLSSTQLNLTSDYETWYNIFCGKDRIIKGIMENKIKLRGIRPTLSQLIILSSLIYLFQKE